MPSTQRWAAIQENYFLINAVCSQTDTVDTVPLILRKWFPIHQNVVHNIRGIVEIVLWALQFTVKLSVDI